MPLWDAVFPLKNISIVSAKHDYLPRNEMEYLPGETNVLSKGPARHEGSDMKYKKDLKVWWDGWGTSITQTKTQRQRILLHIFPIPTRLLQRDCEGAGFWKKKPALTRMLNLWDFLFEHLKASRVHSQIQLLTLKTAPASKGLFVDSNDAHVLPLCRPLTATNRLLSNIFILHNGLAAVLRTTQQFIGERVFMSTRTCLNVSCCCHSAEDWIGVMSSVAAIAHSCLSSDFPPPRWNQCSCCIKTPDSVRPSFLIDNQIDETLGSSTGSLFNWFDLISETCHFFN